MGGIVFWLFGRGISIGCGLDWDVPASWKLLPRDEQIERIKTELSKQMLFPHIDTSCIRNFFSYLEHNTAQDWHHQFVTTNWDYLLQRELLPPGITHQPRWLANGHVFHLNGTVEVIESNKNRSPFLLQEDSVEQRTQSIEADKVFNEMLWQQRFVVVGMSFESEVDKFLLHSLGKVQDDLPIGESHWTLVNPDQATLNATYIRMKGLLPRASFEVICGTLENWQEQSFPSLSQLGVFAK